MTDRHEGAERDAGRTLEVSFNALPILLIGGLALVGYALGGLLGLGLALLVVPAGYVAFIVAAWWWV